MSHAWSTAGRLALALWFGGGISGLGGISAAQAEPVSQAIAFHSGPPDMRTITKTTPGHGETFRDCSAPCPELVVLPSTGPGGTLIGSPDSETGHIGSEQQSRVEIQAFALGKFEVSVSEYAACVADKACRAPEWLEPGGEHNIETGHGVTYKSIAEYVRGDGQPVVGVSWDDAAAYVAWLSGKTGFRYRLPSEAEWEYAARAGTSTAYWWGDDVQRSQRVMACCRGCGSDRDGRGFYPAASFEPNPWGLHNVHGNVWEWVADYFCETYASGPRDGRARQSSACSDGTKPEGLRIFRGGSCFYEPRQMRSAMRLRNWPSFRNQTVGFRIARDIDPVAAEPTVNGKEKAP